MIPERDFKLSRKRKSRRELHISPAQALKMANACDLFKILLTVKTFALDLFFPISCAGCGLAKTHCCKNCLDKIPIWEIQKCHSCSAASQNGTFCDEKCRRDFSFDGIISAAAFKENSVLAKLIHRFKYDFAQEICGDLVKILLRSGCLKKLEEYGKNACIVPVPLHRKRLNFRGFNQSEVLAEEIFKNTGIKTENLLVRIKNTEPQAQLERTERLTNVKNAFEIKPSAKINQTKTYLLLDDVCTTGSTINECAKILKKYGAKTVIGLTVAKAV